MTVAVGIVARRSRIDAARELRHETGAVVTDFENSHVAVLDRLSRRHVDFCVVLEDDAVPVTGFRFHVKQALLHAPAPIVGLYLGSETHRGTSAAAARTARDRDLAWITADCLTTTVGYAIRIRLIGPLLADIAGRDGNLALRITRWAQQHHHPICYTAPSLLDRTAPPPLDCGLGRRSTAKAWHVGTRTTWDTTAVPLGYCPGWSQPAEQENHHG